MDTSFGIDNPFGDARDDFRNGFIAGFTQGRGQLHPTHAQVRDAIEELCKFRIGSNILPARLAYTSGRSEIRSQERS